METDELKELLEEKINRVNDRAKEIWHKVKMIKREIDSKLVKMNEMREQINQANITFATKVDIDNISKQIERNVNDNDRRLTELERKAYTLQGSATITDKREENKTTRNLAIGMAIFSTILSVVSIILLAYIMSHLK